MILAVKALVTGETDGSAVVGNLVNGAGDVVGITVDEES